MLVFSKCLIRSTRWRRLCIRFFHQSHNTVLFGGLFTLKQWIISSLKHDTVPRVNKLYCFYVKNPPKRIALWDCENSKLHEADSNLFISEKTEYIISASEMF